jgi:hypothetical protein
MRHRLLACLLGVAVGYVVLESCQTADTTRLSADLRAHLQTEELGLVTSLRGLPLGVRGALQTLFSSRTLDIVDPTAPAQAAAATSQSPLRRLVVAGCAIDHCLVYYERGGGGGDVTPLAALFHWTPDETRFEWGGIAPRNLKSIDDAKAWMLSGVVASPPKAW